MIDYKAFHNYLVELVGMYQRNRSTKGMSRLAQKWHCTAVTRDQFYQMKLDKLQADQVTPQLSRIVRDTIGRSDAKHTLRETIGALNEGILSGSRISQGSDKTVQITITQPMGGEQQKADVPFYKPGWVVYHRGGEMFLVSKVVGNKMFWNYSLVRGSDGKEYIVEDGETRSLWMGDEDVRRAKGPEVARFVGALERDGYKWRVDNPNGLFFVTGKKQKESPEVFANDLPNGYHGIYALPAFSASPYRFALRCVGCVDNASMFMAESQQPPVVENAILRQLEVIDQGQGCDGIKEYLEYDVPTLCCAEEVREHRVAFVKVNNNGKSYWLAKDRDILRLLAWISYFV